MENHLPGIFVPYGEQGYERAHLGGLTWLTSSL
jgi:hypothetical protein